MLKMSVPLPEFPSVALGAPGGADVLQAAPALDREAPPPRPARAVRGRRARPVRGRDRPELLQRRDGVRADVDRPAPPARNTKHALLERYCTTTRKRHRASLCGSALSRTRRWEGIAIT